MAASTPASIHDYAGLAHPPHLARLESATHKAALVEPLNIHVDDAHDGFAPAFLHLPPNMLTTPDTTGATLGGSQHPRPREAPQRPHHHRTAAILLSGAGGGVTGPSSLYLSLACKLAALDRGVPALRLDYRRPAATAPCVRDVRAAMAYLRDAYALDRFVLVGWSFGGAVAFSAAADDDARVVGCATVASQTADCGGIGKLKPRPVLLMHGSADRVLGVGCSRRLLGMYRDGEGEGEGDGVLKVFEGDDHALAGHADEAEAMLCEFVARCAGVGVGEEEKSVLGLELVEDGERRELMRRGGDLRAPESAE